ncbi:hypothetical protein U1Q18_044933 [Sarracenia purpurea var. burkii]
MTPRLVLAAGGLPVVWGVCVWVRGSGCVGLGACVGCVVFGCVGGACAGCARLGFVSGWSLQSDIDGGCFSLIISLGSSIALARYTQLSLSWGFDVDAEVWVGLSLVLGLGACKGLGLCYLLVFSLFADPPAPATCHYFRRGVCFCFYHWGCFLRIEGGLVLILVFVDPLAPASFLKGWLFFA